VSLQARIRSDFGHLGNVQAGELVQKLDHAELQTILLGHLSEQNNTDDAAASTMASYPFYPFAICTSHRNLSMNKLFVYGTLAPGKQNHGVLSDLAGTWEQAIINGTLVNEGWGAEHGCPGLIPSTDAPEIHG